jgi:putative ABC transport system ATP-binding protein
VTAVQGVTLAVQRGEFVAVVGPSGSGKSTLLNLLGCLDQPTAGQYFLAGDNVARLSAARLASIRNCFIGVAFQSFHLLPRLSALENVELPLLYRGISETRRRRAALEVLERLDLADRSDHLPSRLSGGEQQRVALARAIVGSPLVLLADEPTGSLDKRTGAEILSVLERLNADGMTIVMVTHDGEVARRARRIVRFCSGRIADDRSCSPRRVREYDFSDDATRQHITVV